ncbi:M56 family metallopeptidase [Streptomyces sp. NPDC088789]|uniref:M56 family metallopeptidase n=1 Tax=Streptomyces sp. NPDC088789 TaxID=3365899 RepID=UPI00381A8CFE
MNAAPVLLGYAAGVGLLAPRLLLRSAWPHRAPALAVAVWLGLIVSFTLAVALAAHHLADPTGHLHADLIGLLHSCGLTGLTGPTDVAGVTELAEVAGVADVAAVTGVAEVADVTGVAGVAEPTIADRLAIALPGSVLLLALGGFAREVLRGHRARARHRRVLDLVGRRAPQLSATVVEHDRPAAYCLPGHRPRIVVSAGALRLLTPVQLRAVLDHERAHIAGRHHLALAVTEAFARLLRWLPLARHAREQTVVLLEMVADDRALRRHSREVLATAMYEMAAARSVPAGAFALGGPTALLRLRRVLTPQRRPPLALRGAVAAGAVLVPVLPLLFGCVPAPALG